MNIAKETHNYVLAHPSIKDSLKKGLINYSKLTRMIISETGLKPRHFDAAVVALRRIERELKKKTGFERQIRELLKDTKLQIKNKVLVCIVEKNIQTDRLLDVEKEIKDRKGDINIIEGAKAFTLITSQENEAIIDRYFKNKIIKKNKDLVEIILQSPESLEEVPGVMGYLYSLFAENAINIVETMSCWTDTIFVIEEKNIGKVLEVLNF